MKKIFTSTATAAFIVAAHAQTLNLSNNNGVTYRFPAEITGEMIFDGENVIIADKEFNLNDWSQISVNDINIANNTVEVIYSGDSSSVAVSGNIARYIDVEIDRSHVTVTQSELVSEETCGEITYILKGESADGNFLLSGSYKSTIELHGLSLTNPSGAAIDIENGKRIALSAKNGTVNFLSDGEGSQKGAISCKGHLELKGKGELTVSGNKSHAIYAKEYVEMKNLTLNITKALKDGINCNQYFLIESGSLNISNTGDDGIQTAFKDDANREDEDTGTIFIKGGTVNISVTADAAKCLKADGDVIVSDGVLGLTSSANGIWDSTKNKTKASACIGADGNVTISGGSLDLKATGSGGKGISCDGVFVTEGGKTVISTTGGMLVYSNGTLNHNYTSSADRINSDYKSSAKGIKADGGVRINGRVDRVDGC
ncbi:MAG: carbohydrate-binding domain-containing protein, partial [Muribaculaceae bacterium]|nr:carbohydrate-binding domain-containing protein [Muribaculaceae bacterium]